MGAERKDVRDLSELTADEEKEQLDPIAAATAQKVRRAGLVFFIFSGFFIFIPMLIGVGRGISSGEVWDPDTGLSASNRTAKRSRAVCIEEARRLMLDAGKRQKLERTWVEPYREWVLRCKKDHPELYKMLGDTRQQLRTRQAAPAPGAAKGASAG